MNDFFKKTAVRDFFKKIWPFVEKEFFNTKLNKNTIYSGFVIGIEYPYMKVSIYMNGFKNIRFTISFC
jgi:hypothetical protein